MLVAHCISCFMYHAVLVVERPTDTAAVSVLFQLESNAGERRSRLSSGGRMREWLRYSVGDSCRFPPGV